MIQLKLISVLCVLGNVHRSCLGVLFVRLVDTIIANLHMLDLAELANRNSVEEKLVYFFKCAVITLRHAEESEYSSEKCSRTEDEADF